MPGHLTFFPEWEYMLLISTKMDILPMFCYFRLLVSDISHQVAPLCSGTTLLLTTYSSYIPVPHTRSNQCNIFSSIYNRLVRFLTWFNDYCPEKWICDKNWCYFVPKAAPFCSILLLPSDIYILEIWRAIVIHNISLEKKFSSNNSNGWCVFVILSYRVISYLKSEIYCS